MAVETTNAFSGPFLPNGATLVFPFDFTAPTAGEVSVMLRSASGVETFPTGFDVTVNPGAGGNVTFINPPAAGPELYILLDPDFRQQIGFENGTGWLAEPVNEIADRSAARDQVLRSDINRSLRFPIGEEVSQLPSKQQLAGKFLGGDGNGDLYPASGTGNDPNLRIDMLNGFAAGSRLMKHRSAASPDGAEPVDRLLFNILKRVALTPEGFGGVGDAVYNAGTKSWSGSVADTDALIAWAAHPDPVKILPPGNWLLDTDRLSFADGSILQVDPEAWICGGTGASTGLLWLQGLTSFEADRFNLDMRGAPWANDGLFQVNDALTIVLCENVRIGQVRGRAIFDPANIDAAHCRGDSLLMLSQSERCNIGTVIGDGFPDALAYLNGNGQTAGVANAPLNDCVIGSVIGSNCMAGVTAKRAADNFSIGRIFLDGCDRAFTCEDAAPAVGTARHWTVGEIVGRNVRLDGAIARYADGGRIGWLDVQFAARPGTLSGAAIRTGCDIQGSASFRLDDYRVIFDGSDPASKSAAVVIEERGGTPCSDTRVAEGYSDKAHWRVVELENTHLRTRVGDVQATNDGTSEAVRLLAASSRHAHFHADNSLLLNTDLRFTRDNIGLYARDVDGTYRTMLINALQSIFQASGANIARIVSTGLTMEAGKHISLTNTGLLEIAAPDGAIWRLWVDNAGKLRTANAAPADRNADGTIVGTQS